MIPVVHIGMILKIDLRVSTRSTVQSPQGFEAVPSRFNSVSGSTITQALFKHLKNQKITTQSAANSKKTHLLNCINLRSNALLLPIGLSSEPLLLSGCLLPI